MEQFDVFEESAQQTQNPATMTEPWFQVVENKLQRIKIRSLLGRQFLAELLGTFILVIFGDGAVAQSVLSDSANGAFLSINWGFMAGLMLGVYFSAGISGGHLNPAVSLAMASLGKMPWIALPVYALAQFLGAFLASVMIYAVYIDAINNFDGGTRTVTGNNATAGIWASYPAPYVTLQEGFLDQVLGTALLVACICAITDKRNSKPVNGMEPLIVGFALFAIGVAFGLNCGFPVNPARDLAPRLFTYIAQYGSDVWWTANGKQWWWVPALGPFLGALIGGWTYYLMVELHHPREPSYQRHLDDQQASSRSSHLRNPRVTLALVMHENDLLGQCLCRNTVLFFSAF